MSHFNRLIILFLLLFPFISNAQFFDFTPIPDWINESEIPKESKVTKYEVSDGYYLTLADYQYHLDNNCSFSREVYKIVSYSGITNASQLAVAFDTSYQKLHIHHLIIWRNGKPMNRTNELSFEKMNNEFKLGQGIYSGQITAYDILSDIRKDDLIDFAYSIEGKNPIFNDEKYLVIMLGSNKPIDLYSIQVSYSNEKEYFYNCVDCDSINYQIIESDGYTKIEIINENVKASKFEGNIPSWVIPYNYFILTSMNSWRDVNEWAQEVFTLNEEPNLDEVFSEVFQGDESIEQKINKLIDFVQDDIRYMGIESGIGSIKPFSPDQVVKQRYGDCKDKSHLLVSLLKKIGISEAYTALVNSYLKQETDKHLPSNEIFNHAIVTFNFNGQTYWVDPTIAMQGGDFKDLFTPNYKKALIIGLPADSLSDMIPHSTISDATVTEELTMTAINKPAQLKITSNRHGFEADIRRSIFQYYSANDLIELTSKSLKLVFPEVTKKEDLILEDKEEENRFYTIYNFEVDGFWQDGDLNSDKRLANFWIYKFEPQDLYSFLRNKSCDDREFDFSFNNHLDLTYHYILHFPKEFLFYDSYKIVENDIFYFEEKAVQLNSRSVKISYTIRLKSEIIKASNYKTICEEMNKLVDDLPSVFYLRK